MRSNLPPMFITPSQGEREEEYQSENEEKDKEGKREGGKGGGRSKEGGNEQMEIHD